MLELIFCRKFPTNWTGNTEKKGAGNAKTVKSIWPWLFPGLLRWGGAMINGI